MNLINEYRNKYVNVPERIEISDNLYSLLLAGSESMIRKFGTKILEPVKWCGIEVYKTEDKNKIKLIGNYLEKEFNEDY